jgi:predicted HTH transcriptional regulator
MLAQWDVKTLQSYIDNQIEESLNLDYKAADALQKSDGKKKEISKDVSAMANAAGGLIIYGIKEFDDSAKRHRPEKIDPINRTEISKEWLEQVINSNIQPRIEGLVITPITIDETAATVAYVVEVPQSATAHQASDKRYYS